MYRWYATPWEILKQLPDVASYLKPEWTIAELEKQAHVNSDLQAAEEMQAAKRKLFAGFQEARSAVASLPPIGRRGTPTQKTKTSLEGKTAPFAAVDRLPMVGPRTHKSSPERRT